MKRADQERFQRIKLFLGEERWEKLSQATVTIAGLGAVGSYAVEALARAGVGTLRLVDFDEVRASNINRQLFALHSTVGQMKADAARQRVADISPDCRVEVHKIFIDETTAQEITALPGSLLLDAIDAVNPKVSLIAAAQKAGMPLISSMGAALRSDPAKVRLGLLHEVQSCPLARQVRKRLRNRGASLDLQCVYSLERLPHPLPVIAPEENAFFCRGRDRNTLGSLPTLTGIFGLALASAALDFLAGRAEKPGRNQSQVRPEENFQDA